jgi:hypothetical protein
MKNETINRLIRDYVTVENAKTYAVQQDKGLWLEYEIEYGMDTPHHRIVESLLVMLGEQIGLNP